MTAAERLDALEKEAAEFRRRIDAIQEVATIALERSVSVSAVSPEQAAEIKRVQDAL